MPKRKYGQFKTKPSRMRKRRAFVPSARRRLFRRSTKVPRNIVDFGLAFPRKLKVSHRYIENLSLTSSAAPAIYYFSCNSMYDPNHTGTGHQPMFFDQASLLYNHYVVIGSKITVTAVANTANAGCAYLSLTQDDDAVNDLNPINVSELSSSQVKLIPAGSTTATKLYNRYSAKKSFGANVMANANLRGTTVANTPDQKFWRIGLFEQGGVTNTQRLMVQITYIAIWFEQKELGQS